MRDELRRVLYKARVVVKYREQLHPLQIRGVAAPHLQARGIAWKMYASLCATRLFF